VFSQPWVHAGIQRVVRNIAAQQINSKGYAQPLLVALKGDQIFQVKSLIPCNRISTEPVFKLFSWIKRAQAAVRRKLDSPDYYLLSLPRRLLLRSFLSFAWVAIGVLGFMGVDPFRNRAVKFDVQEGDTLLLLDASWHDPSFFEQVASLRQRGIRIVAVAYDLIPIRHSEYCGHALRKVFDGWLERMSALADAFVCISKWVCAEVQDEIRNRIGEEKMRRKAYGWFHLGSELDRKTGHRVLEKDIERCFGSSAPTFLVVGTIEPRKNHVLILNAFEQYWADGGESQLCIIGRVGWMCDDVVARMKSHPENGRRLFWFNNAGDDELEFAYQNADALVFASFVEGFGLPLVEGLQRGLPAIASDIPVFREVAGDFAEYFDPNSSSDLCAIIDDFSVTRRLPNARPVADWKWITWKESAQQLFDAVEKCCRELDDRKLPENAHQH